MDDTDRSRRGLEVRFIQIYFWTYWLQSINGTYLNLYLKREGGLTGTQIGYLSGMLSAAGVVLAPLIGLAFDGSRRRSVFLANLAIIAAGAFAMYALPIPWWGLIPVAIVFACGWLPLVPLTDSIAVSERVTGASRHGYGGYRRWGTLGFALAGGVMGSIANAAGLWTIFPVYAACGLMVAWWASGIPADVADDRSGGSGPHEPVKRIPSLTSVLELLRLANFRTFLAVVLISSVGSSACYAFRSIYLSSIGLSDRAIGNLWFLIIPGEFVCFTWAARWMKRWGTGPLVSVGLALAGLRWVLLAFARIPALYAVEAIHGIGFAVYFPAAVAFVKHEAPPRLRGTAQILFFSTASGIGNAIGAVVAGHIYDALGMRQVLWFGGGLLIVGGALQSLLVRHKPAERGHAAA